MSKFQTPGIFTSKTIIAATCFLLVAGIAIFYFFVDPTGGNGVFVPKCTMKTLTGWECPGCGFQRAMHAALHGRFAEAFRYNPFLWLALPYVVLLFVSRATDRIKLYKVLSSPIACYIYIGAYFGWWILRNVMNL